MHMRRRSLITLTLCATFAFTVSGVACTFGTDCDFGKCEGPKVGAESPDGSSTDGGADVDASPVPPGCDLTKDPKDSPKCIDEDAGVFVSPTGKPGAAGTRTDPVGSITDALPKLDGPKGRIPRIYVCAGDYSENVSVSTRVDIFGGLDCASWAPGAAKPKFTAKAPGDFALKITGARDISITDVAFAAQAAGQSAANSIAAFVTEASGNVRFARVDLAALEGANGATPAAPGADGKLMSSMPGIDTLDGNMGGGVDGGEEQKCTCAGGKTSSGGRGGKANGESGAAGKETIVPPMPAASTGAGGILGQPCAGPGTGTSGSDGPAGAEADAATGLGELSATGWIGRDGGKGGDGAAGQGGGGGVGVAGAGGGSGSCGGCPGLGGEGGKGGGASIALLVFNASKLSISSVILSTKKAGDGGSGVGGGTGIAGGTAGLAANANACNGGKGGTGGNGGAGAGGAGGVSVGILYKGPKPTSEGVTFTGGTKGGPGGGPGKPGPDGQAAQELEIK